jgi:hypothetical protein
MARLLALAEIAETYNDPLSSSGEVASSTGKPASRPPGELKCDWVAREMGRILDGAVEKAERAINNARPKDGRGTGVVSIGGVAVLNDGQESDDVSCRPRRRRVSDDVIRRHLVVKATEMGIRVDVSD